MENAPRDITINIYGGHYWENFVRFCESSISSTTPTPKNFLPKSNNEQFYINTINDITPQINHGKI